MECRIPNTSRVLKDCAEEFTEPLTLWQLLEEGPLPQSWKEANVSLSSDKGSRSSISSYRPISLTSVCCKIMKKIVRRALLNHMTDNMTYVWLSTRIFLLEIVRHSSSGSAGQMDWDFRSGRRDRLMPYTSTSLKLLTLFLTNVYYS